jgi:hypothetical protein
LANPTTNYGFVMPTPTDLVTDLPADFGVFGQAVDTQMKTNADAATQKATLTTKGDIYAATGTSTPARLAVGANDTVLTADSSTATGLKWAAAASAGAAGVYSSKLSGGNYYVRSGNTTFASTQAVEDRTYYTPIIVSTITADRILCTTAASYSGTTTVRLGIYNNDATLNIPATLLLDAGTVTPTASSTSYEITISQALPAGLYWLAFNMQTAGGGNDNYAGNSGTTTSYSPIGLINTTSANLMLGTAFINGYTESSVTGAFAAAGTLTRSVSNIAIVGLRY